MDEAALRAMLPMGFGKQTSKRRAPAPEPNQPSKPPTWESTPAPSAVASGSSLANRILAARKGKEPVRDEDFDDDGLTTAEREENARIAAQMEDSSDEDLGPEPEDPTLSLPISHEALLKDHSKAVSALDVDPSGTRVATGSYDSEVKLWDFGGMTSSLRPFKSWEPNVSHAIHDLKWSPQGDMLLVIPATAQAQVYTRDGDSPLTYKRGDVYIRDMRRTSGHVSELTSGQWHPRDNGVFLTTATDSSVRIWDVNHVLEQNSMIVVKSKQPGTRTKVTQAGYSPDGKQIATASTDGALRLWGTNSNFTRPTSTVEGAHVLGTHTSGLAWSVDGHTLATRGGEGDDTVKLWDARNLNKPLAVKGDLPNLYHETNLIFSPDERAVLTGSAGDKAGHVNVLNRADLSLREQVAVGDTPGSVVRLVWHSKINQLFASTCKGTVHVYYSPESSSRGALLSVNRASRRRRDVEDFISEGLQDAVADADGDVMLGTGQMQTTGWSAASKRRKLDKIRKDPIASRMPERPVSGPGRGGRIGAAATQHLVQGIYKDNSRAEDPREALLKYADKIKEEGSKYTAAWQETQPTTIFSHVNYASSAEEDDDDRA